MTVIPPTSSLLTAQFARATDELRVRIGDASEAAVTGRYSDVTAHLDGRIGEAMLSQKALGDIEAERARLALRETRLDILQQSLTTIHDTANGLAARTYDAAGSGDTASQETIARDARAALERVFSTLNTRQGERYIFAGDATATLPVGALDDLLDDVRQIAASATDAADLSTQLDTYFNAPGGGWQSDLYAGTVTAADPDAVTAADPAITGLVSGLAVLALSGADEGLTLLSNAPDPLNAAADRVATAQTALVNVRADLGVTQQHIAQDSTALDIEETVLTAAFNDMTARDQYEAATQLREMERNLEASYLLTSRLANLTLLNFLR